MKKKTLTIAIALVLVVALAVGATWAYLTAKTEVVTNTFTVGKLFDQGGALTLKEHEQTYNAATGTYTKGDWQEHGQNYMVQPGLDIPKDPTVNLEKLSVDTSAYVFIGVAGAPADNFNWSVDSKWTKLTDASGNDVKQTVGGVEYTIYTLASGKVTATAGSQDFSYNVLTNDTITVGKDFAVADASGLKIGVIAYACQATTFADAYAAFNACFATK